MKQLSSVVVVWPVRMMAGQDAGLGSVCIGLTPLAHCSCVAVLYIGFSLKDQTCI